MLTKEEEIEWQFDSFCRTVLRNEANSIHRKNKQYTNKVISLSSLTSEDLAKFASYDNYILERTIIVLNDIEIVVDDLAIADAIEQLPEKNKMVILMSFFLDMSDSDISAEIGVARGTVYYYKSSALKLLRKFLEESQ
ncbi:sigma-70 family RNA polymerase sigma factor [Enterococcus faecalis]|nr:sigma-70 family RNA polymerase sigma factor [Enterococcus faecalis]